MLHWSSYWRLVRHFPANWISKSPNFFAEPHVFGNIPMYITTHSKSHSPLIGANVFQINKRLWRFLENGINNRSVRSASITWLILDVSRFQISISMILFLMSGRNWCRDGSRTFAYRCILCHHWTILWGAETSLWKLVSSVGTLANSPTWERTIHQSNAWVCPFCNNPGGN